MVKEVCLLRSLRCNREDLHSNLFRFHLLGLFLVIAFSVHVNAKPSVGEHLPTLTSVEEVRNLPLPEAALGHPVSVRGVVTYYDPEGEILFVQDSTAGIFVDSSGMKLPVKPGQLVELEGKSSAPEYSPIVIQPHLRILGWGSMPTGQTVSLDSLAFGKEDSQWVEVEGIVCSAT
jgi:hypothetical protein